MWEEQTQNYDAMIRVQRAKHNWNDQQLLYITTLHRMTIHMAAGKLKVTEKADEGSLPGADRAFEGHLQDDAQTQVGQGRRGRQSSRKPCCWRHRRPAAPGAGKNVVPASEKK